MDRQIWDPSLVNDIPNLICFGHSIPLQQFSRYFDRASQPKDL